LFTLPIRAAFFDSPRELVPVYEQKHLEKGSSVLHLSSLRGRFSRLIFTPPILPEAEAFLSGLF
jgi:hypothetical protein